MRPYFRQVERIDVIGLRVFFCHDLHRDLPLREVTLRDCVEQIPLRIIRIFAAHFLSAFAGKVLDALFCLEVPLHVKQFIFVVDQAKRVAAESIHVPVAIWCPAV